MGYAIVRWSNKELFNKAVKIGGLISIIAMISFNVACSLIGPDAYSVLAQYNDIFILGADWFIYMIIRDKVQEKSFREGGIGLQTVL